MCGIVGWLSLDPLEPVDESTLVHMRDKVRHRGPDGEGVWLSPDRKVGLGFRRLAIVDLNPNANQPMADENDAYRIVFNGEVYNHRALRCELEKLGHKFKTDHSDTETLLAAFAEWGPKCLDRLQGMWGFAVWDKKRRSLFLARDRVGVKPLYFTIDPEKMLFSSEIKSILAHPKVVRDVDPVAFHHYLSFMTTPAPLTMFQGIYKLPAGFFLVIDAEGNASASRYWDALPNPIDVAEITARNGEERERYCIERTRDLVEAAVEKRTMSDVPIGAFLSGGIDSSTIVALMSRLTDRPVRTFTIGFSDHTELNELEFARAVARKFRTDHHEVLIAEKDMKSYLPELIHAQDEPIADWVCIPLHFVSQLARDSGTIVLEVGEGADEQFCGYASYMAHLKMHRQVWAPYRRVVPQGIRKGIAHLAEVASKYHSRRDPYLDLVVRAGRDREPFWSGANVFPEFRKKQLFNIEMTQAATSQLLPLGLLPPEFLERDSFGVVKNFFSRIDRLVPDADVLIRMIYSEFKLRLPELLLMRVDKIGMASSIEPRVPFLDHRLVEFSMSIPSELKTKNGISKSILKSAVRGLIPDEIIDRKKMGFGAPMVEWLRGEFGRSVEHSFRNCRLFDRVGIERSAALKMLADHRDGIANYATYIWLLYNALAWYDHWIDGSSDVA